MMTSSSMVRNNIFFQAQSFNKSIKEFDEKKKIFFSWFYMYDGN